MSSTYSDVDGSADPADAARWQDVVDGWPQVRAYKRRTLELIGAADKVLDVGCGPGGDVVAVGVTRCIGVDTSMTMCTEAARRGALACRGDSHALPFPEATFGAVRVDRVLQHVAEPGRVLDELVRVTRPGGCVVLAEPDQESLVIHLPGVRQELVDRIKALRRDVGYRNGRLATALPAELQVRGLLDVTVDAFPLTLTNPDDAFGLPRWPTFWRAQGAFTEADIDEWRHGVDRGRVGGFVYSLTFFVVAGTVT